MRCCVPSCNSKGNSCFGIPKNSNLLNLWEASLRLKLKPSYRICSNHFKHEDVIKTWESGKGLSKYTICLKRARLREGAIPTRRDVFPDTLAITDIPEIISAPLPQGKKTVGNINLQNIQEDHCYCAVNTSNNKSSIFDTSNVSTENLDKSLTFEHSTSKPKPVTTDLFKIVFKTINLLNIPPKWFSDISFLYNNDKIAAFHKLSPFAKDFSRCIEKQIVLNKDSSIFLHVYGKKIDFKDIGLPNDYKPESIGDLENIIKMLDLLNICRGALSSNNFNNIKSTFGLPLVELFGQWHHLKCPRILSQNSKSDVCLWCKRLWYCLKNKVCRSTTNKQKTPKKLKTKNAVVIKQKFKTY